MQILYLIQQLLLMEKQKINEKVKDVAIAARNIAYAGTFSHRDVTIDGDSGVNLDEVAAVSRAISEFLDNSDAMGDEPYVLEVGTRGVTKPLTKPVHWKRNIGRLVNVAGDAINAVGRIVEFDEPNVTLDVKGKPKTININEISRAHIEIEFKKMPKEDSDVEALSDDLSNDNDSDSESE
jgi:ribosome maturation factor RimP